MKKKTCFPGLLSVAKHTSIHNERFFTICSDEEVEDMTSGMSDDDGLGPDVASPDGDARDIYWDSATSHSSKFLEREVLER